MTTPEHELAALSGAYVLNAVTPQQRAAFDAIQAQSEDLRAEVVELSDTAVELGLSVAPETPSPELRARILAAIAVTPQLAPITNSAPPDIAPAADAVDEPVVAATPVVAETPAERTARARWFSHPVRLVAAAAAAVALVAGVGVGISAAVRAGDPTSQVQAASDARHTSVAVTGGGNATVMWSAVQGRVAIATTGLPALPADRVYELWVVSGSTATPAGTFTAGSTSMMLSGSPVMGGAVALTVEPVGGSAAPTSAPIMTVPIA